MRNVAVRSCVAPTSAVIAVRTLCACEELSAGTSIVTITVGSEIASVGARVTGVSLAGRGWRSPTIPTVGANSAVRIFGARAAVITFTIRCEYAIGGDLATANSTWLVHVWIMGVRPVWMMRVVRVMRMVVMG